MLWLLVSTIAVVEMQSAPPSTPKPVVSISLKPELGSKPEAKKGANDTEQEESKRYWIKNSFLAWTKGTCYQVATLTNGTPLGHRLVSLDPEGFRSPVSLPPELEDPTGRFISLSPLRYMGRMLKAVEPDGDLIVQGRYNPVFEFDGGTWNQVGSLTCPFVAHSSELMYLGDHRYVVRHGTTPVQVVPGKLAECIWFRTDETGASIKEYRILEMEGDGDPGETGATDRIPDLGTFLFKKSPPNVSWRFHFDAMPRLRRTKWGFLYVHSFTGIIYQYSEDGELYRRIPLLDHSGQSKFFDIAAHPPVVHDAQEVEEGRLLIATRTREAVLEGPVLFQKDWPGGGVSAHHFGPAGPANARVKRIDQKFPTIDWWYLDVQSGQISSAPMLKGLPQRILDVPEEDRPLRITLNAKGEPALSRAKGHPLLKATSNPAAPDPSANRK